MKQHTTKERPIRFKDDNVRAILEDRKTQTRPILNPQPGNGWEFGTASEIGIKYGWIRSRHPLRERFGVFIRRSVGTGQQHFEHSIIPCPYGQPGDRLWVRETWRQFNAIDECGCSESPCGCPCTDTVLYRATHDDGESKWRPSIHMPRWASRITLEITDVRVERLQDISVADAKAEGGPTHGHSGAEISYRRGFRHLWSQINGPDSWDANPWVWVIEFRRITQ
ncbi:hypothetical protein ACJO2E_08730 [Marinobacter sp. M1N3S26]|uniref:hypothetical protein n=1 Tax=Marinobacter sp. M1N3S26 TaxID=3382299 RepID=UPI00387B8A2F